MTEFKFELGAKVKDELTNFKGIVTVRSEHITGCDRYCVRPRTDDTSEVKGSIWFDEQRLVSKEKDDEEKGFVERIFSKNSKGERGASGSRDSGKPTPN